MKDKPDAINEMTQKIKQQYQQIGYTATITITNRWQDILMRKQTEQTEGAKGDSCSQQAKTRKAVNECVRERERNKVRLYVLLLLLLHKKSPLLRGKKINWAQKYNLK